VACSVCREKGHDKRQCPIEREKIQEEITFRRERLNLFFAKTPELLANPVFMGLIWYQLSKNNELLHKANTLILAGDIVGLNIPDGASLGALIQKADGQLSIGPSITGTGASGSIANDLIVQFFELFRPFFDNDKENGN